MRIWLAAAIAMSALACGSPRADDRDAAPAPAPRAAAAAPAAPAVANRPRVVALGDSLTAGLGLPSASAYPMLLEKRLNEAGMNFEVVNAGVSGDTSAGGLERLDWALEGDVRALIVALGANDGLRGLPVEQLQNNLAKIIERAQARHIPVVLAGMEAPPNFGEAYTVSFRQVYSDLAGRYHTAFLPFLLDRVAGVERLNQGDGIHPTAEGARLVADNVWTVLRPMLKGS